MLTPPLRNGNHRRCVIGGGSLHFYGMVVFENLNERFLAAGAAEDSYEVQKYRGYLENWPRTPPR